MGNEEIEVKPVINHIIAEDGRPRFAPGNEIGKLGGRPLGSEDFKTKWFKLLDKVGKKNEQTADQIEERLFMHLFEAADKGQYKFLIDVFNRVYGKAKETSDVNLTGDVQIIFSDKFRNIK